MASKLSTFDSQRYRQTIFILLSSLIFLPARVHSAALAPVEVRSAVRQDVSAPLSEVAHIQTEHPGTRGDARSSSEQREGYLDVPPRALAPQSGAGAAATETATAETNSAVSIPPASVAVEQTRHGVQAPPELLASFDGLGEGFVGPQGTARFRNPSDNSLAVGPNHIVQIVNSRMAVFTKKGTRFDTTGEVLYGPVATGNVFRGFGDEDPINNGDAVVRYDQLADRWLIVMPIFRRLPPRENEPPMPEAGQPAHRSQPRVAEQPGVAADLFQPPPPDEEETGVRGQGRRRGRRARNAGGSYAMCYAISTSSDPLGS